MKTKHIHPYVRYCDKVYTEENFKHYSLAQDCRLFYTIHGNHTLVSNKTVYNISEGDIVYIPHSRPYKSTYSENFSQIKINFDFYDNSKEFPPQPLPLFYTDNPNAKLDPPQKPLTTPFDNIIIIKNSFHYQAFFEEIQKQMNSQRKEFDIIASSLLKSIIAYVQQNSILGSQKTNMLVDAAINYIHNNYMHPITAEQISNALNYHHVYINRQFKLATSYSIHQYLLNYRCEEAKRLLDSTNASIQDIAFDVGFQSAAHFTEIFKKRIGKPPLAYRKEKYQMI